MHFEWKCKHVHTVKYFLLHPFVAKISIALISGFV